MPTYLFFRESGFYPIELDDNHSAIKNAEINPGTIKVADASSGEIVWSDGKEEYSNIYQGLNK